MITRALFLIFAWFVLPLFQELGGSHVFDFRPAFSRRCGPSSVLGVCLRNSDSQMAFTRSFRIGLISCGDIQWKIPIHPSGSRSSSRDE